MIVISILSLLGNSARGQIGFEDLKSSKTSDIATMISTALLASAENTKHLVFDLEVDIIGSQVESEGALVGAKSIHPNPRAKARIVTSLNRGFATDDIFPDRRVTILYDGVVSKGLMYTKNLVRQVFVDCKPPQCPEPFQDFCRITGASCWNDSPNRACSIEPWAAYIRGMEFDKFQNMEDIGQVVVLVINRGQSHSEQWYFGSFEGNLVWCGSQMVSESTRKPTAEWPEHISVTRSNTRVTYNRFNRLVLPTRWDLTVLSETLNLDRTPLTSPLLLRKSEVNFKSHKVLPAFPDQMLEIAIPSDAKIIDNCADRQQRGVEKQVVESNAYSRWWILAIGLGLCAVAVVTWRKLKK